jgi:hypothetical protein
MCFCNPVLFCPVYVLVARRVQAMYSVMHKRSFVFENGITVEKVIP